MAALLSVVQAPNQIPRPTKGFHPSSWGDIFISFSLDNQVQEKFAEAIEGMKELLRPMVMNKEIELKDKLILIDNIERLGVGYHFEKEIEDQVKQIFISNFDDGIKHDLFTTALYFRLLRQHGYDVPCGVFEQFKNKEDNTFKKTLDDDIEGLLSLYETSFVRYHGEDILEEAMVFTSQCLNQLAKPQLDSSYLHEKVTRALQHPIHRGIPKVESRYYISIYEKDKSRNELLLKLAKLDFNFVQNLYKKELSDLFKRWKHIISELPHVRARVAESYFWGMVFGSEPESTFSRLAVAESLIMLTILNDTYDYCTLEEQQVFTEALYRWDIKKVDQVLPNYMKIVCNSLFNTYEEYHREFSKQGRPYAASYARESIIQLAMAYHKKTEWYKRVQMPTFEQHISLGGIVSTIYYLISSCFMGMGSASKADFQWLMSRPKTVEVIGLLGRYMNDISSYEREHEAGEFPNAVDCYMIEHGVSKQETFDKFLEFAEDAWMTLNKEWVNFKSSNGVARHVLKPVLSFAQATEVTYKNGEDGYTNPVKALEPHMVALFINPIII